MQSRAARRLLEFLVVAASLFCFFQFFKSSTVLMLYQERDLIRARDLFSGRFLFKGPEMSGGGNLPGPLYYLLQAIPVHMRLGLDGIWQFFVLALSCSVSALCLFCRERFGTLAAACFLLLYLASWPTTESLLWEMNSSWAAVFACVSLAGLCVVFGSRHRMRIPVWYLTCFAIGLGIQVHLTVLCFLLAGAVLQLLGDFLDLSTLRRKELLLGLLCFVLPILPSLSAALVHFSREPPGGRALGSGGSGVDASIALIKTFLFFLSLESNNGLGFFGNSFAAAALAACLYVLAFATQLLMLRQGSTASAGSGEAPPPARSDSAKALKITFVCTLFTFVPALFPFFTGIAARYGICFVLSFSLCFGAAAARLQEAGRSRLLAFLCGLISIGCAFAFHAGLPQFRGLSPWPLLCLLVAFCGPSLAAMALRRARAPLVLPASSAALAFLLTGMNLSAVSESPLFGRPFIEMAKVIYQQTGWSLEQARERLFFVNQFGEFGYGWMYQEAVGSGKAAAKPGQSPPDGYFVAYSPRRRAQDSDAKTFLLSSPRLMAQVKNAIEAGSVQLGEEKRFSGGQSLIPYFVAEKNRFPERFQNLGDPYGHAQEREIALLSDRGKAGPGSSLLAIFRPCPGSYCQIAFLLSSDQLGDPQKPLKVRILSDMLAQSAPSITPSWDEAILNSYVEFRCGPQTRRIILAESIGGPIPGTEAERRHFENLFFMGQTFLTPFSRQVVSGCTQRIDAIRVGFEGARLFRLSRLQFEELPGEEQTFVLP